MKDEVRRVYGNEKLDEIDKESNLLSTIISEMLDASTISTVGSLDYNVRNIICDSIIASIKNNKVAYNKPGNIRKIAVKDLLTLKDKGTVFSTALQLKDTGGKLVPTGTKVQITHVDIGDTQDVNDPLVHWGSTDDKYFGINYFYGQYGNPIFKKVMNLDDIISEVG